MPNKCPADNPKCCLDKNCLNQQLTDRITLGIQNGWAPDGPGLGPYGAVRWYNRWSTRANPKLATICKPVIDDLLK